MYFCYIDESGDTGAYDTNKPEHERASKYFILVGLLVPVKNWKQSLDYLKSFRKQLAAEAYLPYDVEFHCAELIDPHKIKEYAQLSAKDKWDIIKRFADTVGNNGSFNIIAVVIDKAKTTLHPKDFLTACINKLYAVYDEFLKRNESYGSTFFDRANEKNITTHVRKLTATGSTGETIPHIRIGRIAEDPVFRVSTDSIFIQAADMAAYTLKEKISPIPARKKYNADKIFDNKLYVKTIDNVGDNNIHYL